MMYTPYICKLYVNYMKAYIFDVPILVNDNTHVFVNITKIKDKNLKVYDDV